MGVSVIRILTFFLAFVVLLIGGISGTGRHALSYHFRPPRLPASTSFHNAKEISASLPVSPDFNVEILKPMAQMEQRKLLPLFVIPQTSLHVFPSYAQSPHFPAIEIPLAEPLVLRSRESQVIAPIGFTVFLQGAFHPFYTFALLAPVPHGTHVSYETPVIINVIYAVPQFQHFPSSQEVLTQGPLAPPSKEAPPIEDKPLPFTPFPPSLKETTSNSIVQSDDDTVIIPLDESIPFENAKESPYLQELRLESLKRQVKELQDQIKKLKRLKN